MDLLDVSVLNILEYLVHMYTVFFGLYLGMVLLGHAECTCVALPHTTKLPPVVAYLLI